MPTTLTNRERFQRLMAYQPIDRVPNYEVGIWPQTLQRWVAEGCDAAAHGWDWFRGDPAFNMDWREYARVNFHIHPPFEVKILEETEDYEIIRHHDGTVTKALKAGTVGGGRMSMDQHLSHPVTDLASFREMTKRFDPETPERHLPGWPGEQAEAWRARDYVLVLGENCQTLGFYWRARDFMSTEGLSYAFCLQPELIHEMMAFIADFTIETSRRYVEAVDFDYVFINEDMAMKSGPLLGPDLYRTFIFPHMKRLVEFYKSHNVRYVVVDTDGDPDPLIPLLMEAGVDAIWPMERASNDMDPIALRMKYGRDLRLWGGVDKREIAKGRKAIDAHLESLAPLVEDGGFIPTVDHTVPPDVSWSDFCYYMERKQVLLAGEWK